MVTSPAWALLLLGTTITGANLTRHSGPPASFSCYGHAISAADDTVADDDNATEDDEIAEDTTTFVAKNYCLQQPLRRANFPCCRPGVAHRLEA